MGNKVDKRTIETKKNLKETLSRLLEEKAIEKISIRELTETAHIHRATFYAHYEDIYDLYNDLLESFFSNMQNALTEDSIITYKDYYRAIIDYISKHKAECHMLLFSNTLSEKISSFFIDGCISTWIKENPDLTITDELKFFSYYRVAGIIALLKHWIDGDVTYSSLDLIEYISKLDGFIDQAMQEGTLKVKQE